MVINAFSSGLFSLGDVLSLCVVEFSSSSEKADRSSSSDSEDGSKSSEVGINSSSVVTSVILSVESETSVLLPVKTVVSPVEPETNNFYGIGFKKNSSYSRTADRNRMI